MDLIKMRLFENTQQSNQPVTQHQQSVHYRVWTVPLRNRAE